MMGMNFDGIVSSDADDGLILPQGKDNDRYLRMIDRADSVVFRCEESLMIKEAMIFITLCLRRLTRH